MDIQMTPGQARIYDPVLSSIAHGYRNPDVSRVGRVFFPRVVIPQRGAQILKFGKDSYRLLNARRAPGANTKRVQYGYTAGAIALVQERLEALVPVELQDEATTVPGVDLSRRSIENVQEVFDRAEEYEQVQILVNPANYDVNHKVAVAGAAQWDAATPGIGKQVREAKEAIRASTGRYPNRMGIAPNVFNALAESAEIRDRFKFTSSESVTTAMLAAYFQLQEVVVGTDTYLADADADTADTTDMMSNVAVLAYVPSGASYDVPSFGYTYHLGGHPMVEQGYYDNNARSWVHPVVYERQVVQTGAGAGFLFTNVLAAP